MSVKQMTTSQLKADLDSIARIFQDGIPTEQYDRVNALKGELKRRNEEYAPSTQRNVAPAPNGMPKNIDAMSDDELAQELESLSKRIGADPMNDEYQNRHADVRFELRKRRSAPKPEAVAQVAPRGLEIPEEEPQRVVPRRQEEIGTNPWAATAIGRMVALNHVMKSEGRTLIQITSAMTIQEAKEHVALVLRAIEKAEAAS